MGWGWRAARRAAPEAPLPLAGSALSFAVRRSRIAQPSLARSAPTTAGGGEQLGAAGQAGIGGAARLRQVSRGGGENCARLARGCACELHLGGPESVHSSQALRLELPAHGDVPCWRRASHRERLRRAGMKIVFSCFFAGRRGCVARPRRRSERTVERGSSSKRPLTRKNSSSLGGKPRPSCTHTARVCCDPIPQAAGSHPGLCLSCCVVQRLWLSKFSFFPATRTGELLRAALTTAAPVGRAWARRVRDFRTLWDAASIDSNFCVVFDSWDAGRAQSRTPLWRGCGLLIILHCNFNFWPALTLFVAHYRGRCPWRAKRIAQPSQRVCSGARLISWGTARTL